jgi:hypothetical protein
VTVASARAETLLQESLRRPDVIEGILSFLEKRLPNFPGLATSEAGAGHHDSPEE